MIPAFSAAMPVRLSPRNSRWSIEIEVMAQAAGRSITLVVSPRPPSPTSRMQRSAGSSAKSRKAAAVMTSNTVIGALALIRSTASSVSASAAVSTSPWVRRMRSLKSTRCGEV